MRAGVIGGGIAGLAAARGLANAGAEVVLVEREGRLGGKIATERAEGFLIEAGPDSFLATRPAAVDLCHELGLGASLVAPREPRRVFVWGRGALHPLPGGVRIVPTRFGPIARSRLFTTAEKARIAADLFLPGRPSAGDESLGSLIRRRFGVAALDRLTGPLAAGIYAADADRLSVEATFPRLREAERERGSVMRGLRAEEGRGRAADRSPFVTLRDGLSELVARLEAALRSAGAEVRAGAAVAAIRRSGAGLSVELEDGGSVEVETLVVATPAPDAARLLAPLAPEAAALLASIACVSTAVVTLGYRAVELPPLDGHGFVVARDQPAALTACTWSSSKWQGRAPEGAALLRVYLGSATRPLDPGAGDEGLIAAARRGLADAMGVDAEPILTRVDRWPAAMPQYDVGHRERVGRIRALLASGPGLAVAGAAYRGVGIPDCVLDGFDAASRLAGGARAGGAVARRLD